MFKHKRVIVTGGTGLIGRKVVDLLCEEGAEVVVLSNDDRKLRNDVEYITGDLAADFEFCQVMTENADYVFHIAGLKGSPVVTSKKPASYFVPLLQMNTNVLEACRINEVKRVIYTSSVGVYEEGELLKESTPLRNLPMDFYPGIAKRCGEIQLLAYWEEYELWNYHIVRPSNVYGEGDNFDPDIAMVIPALVGKILRGDNPVEVWGDGSEIRDFVYSGDVARGMLQVMGYNGGLGLFNLGGAKGYSVKQIVEILKDLTGVKFHFNPRKKAGFPIRVLDISKARKSVGYDPKVTLEEGLETVWKSVKPH